MIELLIGVLMGIILLIFLTDLNRAIKRAFTPSEIFHKVTYGISFYQTVADTGSPLRLYWDLPWGDQ